MRRTAWALGLQALALLALVWALWGGGPTATRVLVLLDRSDSMPAAAVDAAWEALRQAGGTVVPLAFAGRPGGVGESPPPAVLQPARTDLAAALHAALAAHAREPFDRLVLVSDGQATQGDTESALQAVRSAGLPLHWQPVAREAPGWRLRQVLMPPAMRQGQSLEISAQFEGRPPAGGRITAQAVSGAGESVERSWAPEAGAPVQSLRLPGLGPGDWQVQLQLVDAHGAVLDQVRRGLHVAPAAALLFVQGGATAPLAEALQAGGWALRRVAAARMDAEADRLNQYRAVVLDNVSVSDASTRFWQALQEAVRDHGLRLLVLGGERAFGAGAYRGSLLETLLPVEAVPPQSEPATRVLFLVDKSGSMGEGRVARFDHALNAVRQTAARLRAVDQLGLMVFDVAPRWLLPFVARDQAQPLLARGWGVAPGGGTRLTPALDAAMAALAEGGSARRLLVVVSDGAVEERALEGLRGRLARERIDLLWLPVGAPEAARKLVQALGADAVAPLGEAADLSQAMRAGVARRQSAVVRGPVAVRPVGPLPVPGFTATEWPPLWAHASTTPRPTAQVALRSGAGEALLAVHRLGAGAVMALPGGLGDWAPAWLRWRQWSSWSGALGDWLLTPIDAQGLRVSESAQHLRLAVDADRSAGPPQVRVTPPGGSASAVALQAQAPGRWEGQWPLAADGPYRIQLEGAQGVQTWVHWRWTPTEGQPWGLGTALLEARKRAWVESATVPWEARHPRTARPTGPLWPALALFVLAVLVDRGFRRR